MKVVVSKELARLYALAAAQASRIISQSISERGRSVILFSGGRTPIPVYERLASLSTPAISWDRVWIGWADERCVPPDHELSNYRSIFEHLLARLPIPSDQILRIRGEEDPLESAETYEAELRRLLGSDGRADLIMLGMGTDGHTASLFPGHRALEEDKRWVLPVKTSAEPPWRVTLTLEFINRGRNILILTTGAEKEDALKKLQQGVDLPISRVKPPAGSLLWFSDRPITAPR